MDDQWARLGRAIEDQRMAMGIDTQGKAAARVGVSDTIWNMVANGKPVGDRSLAKIGLGLWDDPKVPADILDGAEPPDRPPSSPSIEPDLLAAVRELTEIVRELRADLREGRR